MKIEVLDPSIGVLLICLVIDFLQICKIQVWKRQDLKDPNSYVNFEAPFGSMPHFIFLNIPVFNIRKIFEASGLSVMELVQDSGRILLV